jgi:hypothetical protein
MRALGAPGGRDMREFIRTYGKHAGLFAAAAFVLSFVTGIVARNAVGTIVLRAVLLAALFCGLGVGLQFVVRKFLPELTGAPPAAPGERASGSGVNVPGTGAVVDIVLPEENPLEAGRAIGGITGEGVAEPAGEAGLEEALEEAAEERTAVLEEPGDGSPAEETPSSVEPAESVAEASEPSLESPKQSGSPRGLDALPDIGSLEASGPAPGRPRARRRTGTGASPEEAMRSLASQEDPSTLARAIRTVLKREEKG